MPGRSTDLPRSLPNISSGWRRNAAYAARSPKPAISSCATWTAASRNAASWWRRSRVPHGSIRRPAAHAREGDMSDFWLSSGHHLLDREDGGLVVSDAFLKVYFARSEERRG